MKKLTKDQEKTRTELVDALREKWTALEAVYAEVNSLITSKLNEAIGVYNGAISDVEGFRDEVTGAIEEYVDERSEKWQESDAASNYESWKGEWENLDLTAVEEVEELELPDSNVADELEGLQSEVES